MHVLVAVTSSETQYVSALTSCYEVARREGDDIIVQHLTHGYVARVNLVDIFLVRREFDAILLLDADQRHPVDLLERLRDAAEASDLDMVCAHYYRRGTNPVQSLCYALGDGTYPYLPLLDPPTTGLHEIGLAGFGCVLIRRRVLEAVARTLPPGESPVSIGPLPEHTGKHDVAGADFRFFMRARALGYRLWLLADVESAHGMTFWLNHKGAARMMDYGKWAEAALLIIHERLELHGMSPEVFKQRLIYLEAIDKDLRQQYQAAQAGGATLEQLQEISVAIIEVGGKKKECQAWLELAEKYPAIERPDQLPTTDTMPPMEQSDETAAMRVAAQAERTSELVKLLPGVADNLNGAGRSD